MDYVLHVYISYQKSVKFQYLFFQNTDRLCLKLSLQHTQLQNIYYIPNCPLLKMNTCLKINLSACPLLINRIIILSCVCFTYSQFTNVWFEETIEVLIRNFLCRKMEINLLNESDSREILKSNNNGLSFLFQC